MAKVKAYSDRYLNKLWRDAVLIKNAHRCFLCGNMNINELECHHIVKRRNKILRYDFRNGVPVCRFKCHQKIDSISGRLLLTEIRPYDIIHCIEFENKTLKSYLTERCITENEFLMDKHDELNGIINNYYFYQMNEYNDFNQEVI